MNFYFAPMEGVTGYLFRQAHQDFYKGIDKYFIPFIEPRVKREYNAKEKQEIRIENNEKCLTIPQILTKNAEDFLRTARVIADQGYEEINLNLGCPSGTVVSKGKGSGMLADVEALDQFLEQIYEQAPCGISIKTRIGRYSPEEFPELLEIYNKYPVKELTVHPRTREDYYKNIPDWDAYRLAAEGSKNPVCYNGNLFTKKDYDFFIKTFPETQACMLGRGLVSNPGLVEEIREGKNFDLDKFIAFHGRLYRDYCAALSGDRTLLYKMKELWSYWQNLFPESEKLIKKVRKAKNGGEYLQAVQMIFSTYRA